MLRVAGALDQELRPPPAVELTVCPPRVSCLPRPVDGKYVSVFCKARCSVFLINSVILLQTLAISSGLSFGLRKMNYHRMFNGNTDPG